MNDSFVIATPEQLAQLNAEVDELMARYRRVGQGNPAARRVAVYTVDLPDRPRPRPRRRSPMTTPALTAVAARRVLLLLSFTRWFPVGLSSASSRCCRSSEA